MVSAKQPASLADELLRGDLDCGGAVFAGFPSSKDASELVATVTKEAKQAIIEAAPVFRRSGAGPHARRSCPRSRGSRLRRGCRRRRSVPCSSSRSSSSSLVVAPPLAVAPSGLKAGCRDRYATGLRPVLEPESPRPLTAQRHGQVQSACPPDRHGARLLSRPKQTQSPCSSTDCQTPQQNAGSRFTIVSSNQHALAGDMARAVSAYVMGATTPEPHA